MRRQTSNILHAYLGSHLLGTYLADDSFPVLVVEYYVTANLLGSLPLAHSLMLPAILALLQRNDEYHLMAPYLSVFTLLPSLS